MALVFIPIFTRWACVCVCLRLCVCVCACVGVTMRSTTYIEVGGERKNDRQMEQSNNGKGDKREIRRGCVRKGEVSICPLWLFYFGCDKR